MPVIAPWLQTQPSDFTSAIVRGTEAGQRAVAQRNQAAQAAQRADLEQQQLAAAAQHLAQQQKEFDIQHAASQEKMQQDFEIAQQAHNIDKSYKDQSIGIEQRKLDEKVKDAADRMAGLKAYSADVAGGTPAYLAILKHPELMTNGTLDSSVSASLAPANQAAAGRLAIAKLKYPELKAAMDAQQPTIDAPGWGTGDIPNPAWLSASNNLAQLTGQFDKPTQGAPAAAPTLIWDAKLKKPVPVGQQQAPVVPPANAFYSGDYLNSPDEAVPAQ